MALAHKAGHHHGKHHHTHVRRESGDDGAVWLAATVGALIVVGLLLFLGSHMSNANFIGH